MVVDITATVPFTLATLLSKMDFVLVLAEIAADAPRVEGLSMTVFEALITTLLGK